FWRAQTPAPTKVSLKSSRQSSLEHFQRTLDQGLDHMCEIVLQNWLALDYLLQEIGGGRCYLQIDNNSKLIEMVGHQILGVPHLAPTDTGRGGWWDWLLS
uniref:Uncharacterized protein n=1 Tax=Varanus komodoensis TaxID=61221 RepID=A0A8D2LM94_VARKO